MSVALVERFASRVLLLNWRDEVLLFHGHDPGDRGRGSWWFTPGGGLEASEQPAVGAARELYEETGLRLDPATLVGPVYEQVIEFPFEGLRYRQFEGFYVARVGRWTVDTIGFTPLEQRSVDGHRWWSVAELRATDERFYPAHLVDLLTEVLAMPAAQRSERV
jgi:8-oxo-dGTP pyrophosphatase MutT (NUDIX family)